MRKSYDILEELRRKFQMHLRPNIARARILKLSSGIWLEISESRHDGSITKVSRELLEHIGGIDPSLSLLENATVLLNLGELGIIHCTELFTSEAVEEILAREHAINANELRAAADQLFSGPPERAFERAKRLIDATLNEEVEKTPLLTSALAHVTRLESYIEIEAHGDVDVGTRTCLAYFLGGVHAALADDEPGGVDVVSLLIDALSRDEVAAIANHVLQHPRIDAISDWLKQFHP